MLYVDFLMRKISYARLHVKNHPFSAYNERVVAFLRQPGLEDIFKNKDCNLSAKNALR